MLTEKVCVSDGLTDSLPHRVLTWLRVCRQMFASIWVYVWGYILAFDAIVIWFCWHMTGGYDSGQKVCKVVDDVSSNGTLSKHIFFVYSGPVYRADVIFPWCSWSWSKGIRIHHCISFPRLMMNFAQLNIICFASHKLVNCLFFVFILFLFLQNEKWMCKNCSHIKARIPLKRESHLSPPRYQSDNFPDCHWWQK